MKKMVEKALDMGSLFVVATPIGCLQDMTYRAVAVLAEADTILAEDTRHSRTLLAHYQVTTPMHALHAHNEAVQCERWLAALRQGAKLALISDAGTPLIADPGYGLVHAARQAGFAVHPVPGPCAAVAALSVAGLPCHAFVFQGFLPASAAARRQALTVFKAETRTAIFYEAPHRMLALVEDMVTVFGPDRPVVCARELTKRFETVYGCSLGELGGWLQADANRTRGEFVVLLGGVSPSALDNAAEVDRVLALLQAAQLPTKQVAQLTAQITGASKNQIYAQALCLQTDES